MILAIGCHSTAKTAFWTYLNNLQGYLLGLSPVSATTIPLAQIPLGKVVQVNGMNFIKIAENKYQSVCGQMACAEVEHCSACSLTAGNPCHDCEDGYHLDDGVCEEGEPTPPTPTTLQAFTSANCSAMSAGSTMTVTNSGSGSYIIRKLADNNCYVNMNVSKQWYTSNTTTVVCTPSNNSFAACNTCYAINNNNDWFLPMYAHYTALLSAAGTGSQLYTALGLDANTHFWSSSEYASNTLYAWYLYVNSSSAGTDVDYYKTSSVGVLCRRN